SMYVSGTVIAVLICCVRGHRFYSHLRTPSERKGQPYWLSLARIEDGRIRVFHQGDFMMLLFTQDEWAWKKLFL
ncbi:hypothetical protein ACTXT7_014151, partial [Hymenolepis weldensis]